MLATKTPHCFSLVTPLRSQRAFGVSSCLGFRFGIEGVPNAEARLRYAAADVVVDQLRIGWYGMFAIESMALAKPVVVHLDEQGAAETEEAKARAAQSGASSRRSR